MFSEFVNCRTADVIVSVQTAYLPTQSTPEANHFMFAYRVRITNASTSTVQLRRRKWLIVDAYGRRRRVEGDGVVGQQPVLAPGESYEYISGCDFPTPIGQMKGSYYMVQKGDTAEFKVRIPTFTMATPPTNN
jgi:ApaG protein